MSFKIVCNFCNEPKDDDIMGVCTNCIRISETELRNKKIEADAKVWFSGKKYTEQHALSDTYFDSRNPSLLSLEDIVEMYVNEHIYCVSSESIVRGKQCTNWCGGEFCLRVDKENPVSDIDKLITKCELKYRTNQTITPNHTNGELDFLLEIINDLKKLK